MSSTLVRTEVLRSVDSLDRDQVRRAREVLSSVSLIRVSDRVLDAAGRLQPRHLRSLDAIHLATAEQLEDELGSFVTYDERLAAAASARGMKVVQPR